MSFYLIMLNTDYLVYAFPWYYSFSLADKKSINRLRVLPFLLSLVNNKNASGFETILVKQQIDLKSFDTLMICISVCTELQLCHTRVEPYSCKTTAIHLNNTY